MPLVIKLETTTGLLKPGGVALPIARGPQEATLQFLTDNVAALLADGAPIALKLYAVSDTVTPIATFGAWTAVPAWLCYKATLNPLGVAALGYLPACTLLGRISYGTPNVDTPLFHVLWGGSGEVTGAPVAPIVVVQRTGPAKYVQSIGAIVGKAQVGQVDGFWRVNSAGDLVGLQLAAQVAPGGADLIVEVIKNGVATGKTAKLTAASKSEETVFAGGALALAIGDVVKFKPTQIGDTTVGSNLSVAGMMQLT